MSEFITDPKMGSENGNPVNEVNENVEINDPSNSSELDAKQSENFNDFIEEY